MGRSVANEGFLRALLRLDPFDAYHFFLADMQQGEQVGRRLADEFPALWKQGKFSIATYADLPTAIAQTAYHCFHLSDCISHPAHLAALRNRMSQRIFPITGVTHSLSYARYASAFLAQLWQGTTERDAVIATSRAAVGMVNETFAWLREGYSMPDNMNTPSVERIPLGIDCAALPEPTTEQRSNVRQQYGMKDGDIALLLFARVSHYSKMDVIPLFRALQRLAMRGVAMDSIHIVMAGYVQEGDSTPQTLAQLASALGVAFHLVPSPSDEQRNGLYAAADVFVSPVDNVQETFGLTVLEAGAMGLPVVASDFDGYRDLVRNGETGVLVSTIGPDVTDNVDMMANLTFDSTTHLELAQQTAVDVAALADALELCISQPEKRKAMGNIAKEHVRKGYDWDVVIEQYIALWQHLNAVEVAEEPAANHPLHMPYARLFGNFPSEKLSGEMRVQWSTVGQAVYRGVEHPIIYGGVEKHILRDALKQLLFMARKPIAVSMLAERLEGLEESRFLIMWALKQDLLERVHGE